MASNFKKGKGSKVKKVCRQVRDQMVWKEIEDTAQGGHSKSQSNGIVE